MSVKSKIPHHYYILFYKPYGVLSQFTDQSGRKTLSEFGPFPQNVYPVGRLDADSEGLLLLTNDPRTKHRMLDPGYGHWRTYLAQVERIPTDEALAKLREGVVIDGFKTKKARAELLRQEPELPPREVPIRFRKNIPTSWLEISITEGRNRQVRKMTAAIGHPTLRLVRTQIGVLTLDKLDPGQHRDLTESELRSLLHSLAESPTDQARNRQ
jgi:23S rRNA pseudouridine2457 synthase